LGSRGIKIRGDDEILNHVPVSSRKVNREKNVIQLRVGEVSIVIVDFEFYVIEENKRLNKGDD
jgi:hypothetical protein